MTHYNLTGYADIARITTDKAYAKSKSLLVKKQNDLYVIKYDKTQLNKDNLQSLGLFRSIVTDGQKLLAFSPPKSVPLEVFKENYPISEISLQEFVEGTMINCFYHDNQWKIATRWNIGARNAFYQDNYHSLSFCDMFLEAMTQCQLNFTQMNMNYCYSFVLQHPQNRIVVPFSKPHLVLINIYNISNETPWNISEIKMDGLIPHIARPIKYSKCDTIDLHTNIKSFISVNTPYTILGIVLIHGNSGIRSKARNPIYEKVRNLKGNSSKIQFQYYNLYKDGNVKEFLTFYPEYKQIFWNYRQELIQWTDALYELYKEVYVRKIRTQAEIPYAFRPHLWTIHDIYLHDLRDKKLIINKKIVREYIRSIPSARLMYAINYPLRQKQKDDVKGIIYS